MKFLLKTLKTAFFVLVGGYVIFLSAPFALNFAAEKYKPAIADIIKKSTGLNARLDGVKFVTTPKLTAGISVDKFGLTAPDNEPVLSADNFRVKMSLIPLLSKTLRIDTVQLDEADVYLLFEKDSSLAMMKYFPQSTVEEENAKEEITGLPLGFKLSDSMPDIHAGKLKITLTDGIDSYVINENKTDITNFIINKHVKISTSGNIVLKDEQRFTYDIKLFNKIMPEAGINELIFSSKEEDADAQQSQPVNITEILKGLYDIKAFANVVADLKTEKDNTEGSINISGVSLIGLPESNADLSLKGDTINLLSNIYTAENEKTTLSGKVTTGNKPFVNINVKTALELSNLIKIIKDAASIFNIKDFQTLTGSGKLNADFSIKSDMKTVESSGYLKIPSAKFFYGLYNVGIDKISADIALDNNNINIKDAGFTVFSQPLKLYGTLSQDAVCNLHLNARQLDIKGLLIASGQASLLKENQVNSGTVSANVDIKGKIDSIKPVAQINVNNLNVKNIPADMTLKSSSTILDINSDGKTFSGILKSENISLLNPALSVNIPAVNGKITENEIEILKSSLNIEKIKTDVSGKISNYLTEKIGLNFISTGDIKSRLSGDLNINKQTLNLNYSTTDLSSIIIPGFDKSKMTFTGKIDIKGAMSNPVISGTVNLPEITIPEIPVKMTDTALKLNGEILHGVASAKTFESGGIKAENATTEILLKGNDLYLKNLKGSAFSGKFSGDVAYNISNARTVIDFQGSGMNAESAIDGAAGIKKALTGTLGFDAKLSTDASDFELMMKTLKGDVSFDVKKGAYGSIGQLRGLLNAKNILTDSLLKNTMQSVSNVTALSSAGTFDGIEGKIKISDAWAVLDPVKSEGGSLCYYVTGKYNIINGTTNVTILGRLDGETVSSLGAIGELSAEKLLSSIPKFGESTAKLYGALTENPDKEKTNLIPALTGGKKTHKDFKVEFNGGLESQSSVKSFKWLTKTDATLIDKSNVKDTVQDIKSAIQTDVTTNVNLAKEAAATKKKEVTDTVNAVKSEIDTTKKQINETKQQINDLKNMFKEVNKQPKDNSTDTKPAAGEVKNTSDSSGAASSTAVKTTETKPSEKETETAAAASSSKSEPASGESEQD